VGVLVSSVRTNSVMMRKSYPMRFCLLASLAGVLCLMVLAGCQRPMNSTTSPDSRRDINAVLRDHDKELMAVPGVVGVYVGLLEDEKTPCLKVMAARKTAALQRQVPKSLEGYPVVVEETGVIRPMRQK
jgi:hypothetical protein